MTVRRRAMQTFNVEKNKLATHVRTVLKSNPNYRYVKELQDGTAFVVNVLPSRWLLDTDMTVSLTDDGSQTLVTVSTESQPFIFGDIFDFYNRYIEQFLIALEDSVHGEWHGPGGKT